MIDIITFCFSIDLKFPHHTNEIAQAEAHDYIDDKNDNKVSFCNV